MISKSEERRNQILVGAFKLFLVKECMGVNQMQAITDPSKNSTFVYPITLALIII